MITAENISQEIYAELGEPDNLSVAQIKSWVASNIGQINSLLYVDFVYDEDNDTFIKTEDSYLDNVFEDAEKEIYKQLYFRKFYKNLMLKTLNSAETIKEGWVQITEEGSTIRRSSRTEVSRYYNELLKNLSEYINDLVRAYRISKDKVFDVRQFDIRSV